MNDSISIGGVIPIVIGNPKLETDEKFSSMAFNGESDGLNTTIPVLTQPTSKISGR